MLEKGKIHYDKDGLLRCHICGKSFKKVCSHVWHSHGISARDYKKMYGLDLGKGIVCQETREKLQENVKKNYDKSVKQNLLEKGVNSRFEKGHKGRTKDMVSLQTKYMLIESISNTK